ncbi:MAG TPA: hypothetical protein P5105_01575 [Victivallales bacterium]|nr:hypothetical protein [Victivallales bacterium]HPO90549.1 hypothetical protein [Victivallales bacterium]HRR05945.1 hypothetical protein [Victivallales bacterium]HRR28534.1 hypothetical protein [Victivallales bacterium]HRU01676.1 hypothetical protein [Victivallales bacterium]
MKITKIPFDDILFDSKTAADIIANVCKRSKLHVSGLCELSESVAIIFSDGMEKTKNFTFAKFAEENDEGKIAEIHDRYRGGFDLIGTFFIDDQLWGLFKKKE